MASQNLAVKLCGILQAQSGEEVTAREWRLLGQEEDGSQLFRWISTENEKEVLNIGVFTNKTKTLKTLHSFDEKLNIIQASVNPTHTLLVYVVKQLSSADDEKEPLYCPFLICLLPDKERAPEVVEEGSTKQIFLQYVYGKSHKYSPGIRNDRFILFKHLEYIKIYRSPMFLNEFDDGTEKWGFDGIYSDPEKIVNVFSWAQWDCVNQILYYIYYRQPQQSFAEGEEAKSPAEVTPTLSALQFHADLPHETVMNIPLSVGHLHAEDATRQACGAYEDDPAPLRVHDCSLDLLILCDQQGLICICHHYLYKPLDDSTTSLVLEDSVELKDSCVNFAYSITLLHHGCVVHSVVNDLPWTRAKALRPSYTLYGDSQLLVNIPMLYTHLIDISLAHEPCCSIVLLNEEADSGPSLAPILGFGNHAMVDLNTLDIVTLNVAEKDLTAAFKNIASVDNKLAIIHYLVQHEGNFELAEELLSWLAVNQAARLGALQLAVQEYLVAAAHASTRRALPASSAHLAAMLPYSLHLGFHLVKVRDMAVSVSSEQVWNSSAVVLAGRQRVCQFAEDVWTRVWARLSSPRPPRACPAAVRGKLHVTLHCYQPEALSRCTTPLSPSGPAGGLGAPPRRASLAAALDQLPFYEVDVCTASKQEHVIAANLREVSLHLMRGLGSRAELAGVHGVATRYAAAQLDVARAALRALCRAAAAAPLPHQPRGFPFVDELDPAHAYVLFKLLEQFYLAADGIAFPLPQGFSSFLTYLGYKALPFHAFIQYVHRNVLELQIDVIKAIISSKDTSKRSINNKLRLIQVVGENRGRRALGAWRSGPALVLRARDHAHTLLSGDGPQRAARPPHRDGGVAALPPGERLSPLDTFLDLLTAKASLNELDFNLIIEATLATVRHDLLA